MTHEIARDLSRKLQADLGAVLERQIRMAAVVLDGEQVSLIIFEAAVMMVRSVAATIAILAIDDTEVENVLDKVVEQVVAEARSSRPDIIARVMAERKVAAA